MFRARTVFVIGAGASAELKFPLGSALLGDIAKRVDISYEFGRLNRGDHVVADALRGETNAQEDVTSYNEHLHSAWQLVKSSKQGLSIDNVLDALEDEKASLVGKLGIVRSILCSEESSVLSKWIDHFPNQIKVEDLSHTWLGQLSKLLTEGRRKSDISSIFENLTIVNFNYDRTIEQYLPFAISEYYGLSPTLIRELMPSLPVFRPYGKAGSLPWEGMEGAVNFGHCTSNDLRRAAPQILTFTEQVNDDALILGIHAAVSAADRIVFLGFGYHRQNIELLATLAQKHVQIFGTSFGMSESDTRVVSDELTKMFGLDHHMVRRGHNYANLLPLECAAFMAEIWRTLTTGPSDDPTIEMGLR